MGKKSSSVGGRFLREKFFAQRINPVLKGRKRRNNIMLFNHFQRALTRAIPEIWYNQVSGKIPETISETEKVSEIESYATLASTARQRNAETLREIESRYFTQGGVTYYRGVRMPVRGGCPRTSGLTRRPEDLQGFPSDKDGNLSGLVRRTEDHEGLRSDEDPNSAAAQRRRGEARKISYSTRKVEYLRFLFLARAILVRNCEREIGRAQKALSKTLSRVSETARGLGDLLRGIGLGEEGDSLNRDVVSWARGVLAREARVHLARVRSCQERLDQAWAAWFELSN